MSAVPFRSVPFLLHQCCRTMGCTACGWRIHFTASGSNASWHLPPGASPMGQQFWPASVVVARLQGEEPAAVDAVMKTEQKEVQDWAVQNDNKPLWTRSPREVRPTIDSLMLSSGAV
jgi:hypothetical protein